MADEMTQEPTVESAPAAPEPSTAVAEETQQVQVDQSTAPASDTQPEAASEPTSDIEEWNGNDVESLPKPLQARAKGMLRHLHKVTQEAAAVKHLAQAYHELTNHPEFQEFLQYKNGRSNSPVNEQKQSQEPLISEDDFLAAQADPQKFVEVQNKLLMQQAQPVLQKLQALEEKVQMYEQNVKREQASKTLEAFAKQHPDFWDIHPAIMKSVLQESQKRGGSIEDAYKQAKALEKQYLDKAHGEIKKNVETKKKAVTASPSKSMEPEVIYVANKQEASRVAFENAKLGKRVDVRVKR